MPIVSFGKAHRGIMFKLIIMNILKDTKTGMFKDHMSSG